MAKRKLVSEAPALETEPLTGIALTTVASRDQGFNNFRLCVLFIVDGQIVHIEKTQEFAFFESIARSEILIDRAHWRLTNHYKPGAYLSLGGDDRDRLVNRLKAENPELLARIAPALGITP